MSAKRRHSYKDGDGPASPASHTARSYENPTAACSTESDSSAQAPPPKRRKDTGPQRTGAAQGHDPKTMSLIARCGQDFRPDQLAQLKQELDAGLLDPLQRSEQQATALHVAAYYGHETLVEYLLSRSDYHVDAVAEDSVTALYNACHAGHVSCAEMLLAAGADPLHVTDTRATPLHVAVFKDRVDVVRCLLQRGAPATVKDGVCCPLLALCGSGEVAELLLEYGANLTLSTEEGQRTLFMLGSRQKTAVLNALYRKGLRVDLTDMCPGLLEGLFDATSPDALFSVLLLDVNGEQPTPELSQTVVNYLEHLYQSSLQAAKLDAVLFPWRHRLLFALQGPPPLARDWQPSEAAADRMASCIKEHCVLGLRWVLRNTDWTQADLRCQCVQDAIEGIQQQEPPTDDKANSADDQQQDYDADHEEGRPRTAADGIRPSHRAQRELDNLQGTTASDIRHLMQLIARPPCEANWRLLPIEPQHRYFRLMCLGRAASHRRQQSRLPDKQKGCLRDLPEMLWHCVARLASMAPRGPLATDSSL